ncbi:hypothetical protein ABFS83_03G010700 [Erythranthe nasuta]
MGSEQNRFLQPQQASAPRSKRWGGCLGGLSCFRKQKGGGKRIVPSSRIPEGSTLSNQPNGAQSIIGLPIPTTGIAPSLFAPPSSPASFSNSALQSTAQSPTCFLSANSPCGGPSSTMFVTGPYAHETQLVSPPVFSTFTTEPSTAPLTPPPELAHLTTPSSPDVPYARFLSSSASIKRNTEKGNYDLIQSTYSLYPGSPALRSPAGGASTPSPAGDSKSRQDSNFFCPETFAQFYLDQSSFAHSGGRLSISRETDAYANGHQNNNNNNRQSKISNKPHDAEELEAYRASFGFSADEIITTAHYVEISDVGEEYILTASPKKGVENWKRPEDFPSPQLGKGLPHIEARNLANTHVLSDDEDIFAKMGNPRNGRKYHFGSSNSDAEVEYRRGRSLREERSWRES